MIINNRIALAMYFGELGFKKGAEIGVFRGRYSKRLWERMPGLKLFSVDSWMGKYEKEEAEARASLGRFPGITIIKGMSTDVAKTIPDASLDFVYIDGDHDYEAAKADIEAWTPKVRVGGIVSGHDYQLPDVRKAVDEVAKKRGVELSVTTTDNSREHPSWFFRV